MPGGGHVKGISPATADGLRGQLLANAAIWLPAAALGTLLMRGDAVAQPANDDFADAIVIGALPFTDERNNEGATLEIGEPPFCLETFIGPFPSQRMKNSVWYSFTPDRDMELEVDTLGSDPCCLDTILAAYVASGIDSGVLLLDLKQVACDDEQSGTMLSMVSFSAQAGETYYFQVAGTSVLPTGDLVFNLRRASP